MLSRADLEAIRAVIREEVAAATEPKSRVTERGAVVIPVHPADVLCDFCRKHQRDVEYLAMSEVGVRRCFICDECVELCATLFARRSKP